MIIKDKVKTKLPSISKQLHGHVCIDLHNHNSGFTERIEADNVVTSALDKIFPIFFNPENSTQKERFFPIASKALGGIMLLGEQIGGSTELIDFPYVPLVGFAGQTQNADNPFMGSFNALESQRITNGFRSVWDFSTAQANGTIKALARTNEAISNGPTATVAANYWNDMDSGSEESNLSYKFIYYNAAQHYAYAYSNQSGKNKIYKINVFFDEVPVDANYPNSWSIEDTGKTLPNDVQRPWVPAKNGKAYTYRVTQNGSNYDVAWYVMACDNDTFDVVQNITHSISESIVSAGNENYGVVDGYGYIFNSTYTKVYKLNMSNPADITAISIQKPNGTSSANMDVLPTGVVRVLYYNSNGAFLGYSTFIYPLYANKALYIPVSEVFQNNKSVTDNSVYYICSDSGYSNSYFRSVIIAGYMGTKANITTVTKTASQSMKVTYDLTNV